MMSALFKFLPSWFYAHCVKYLFFDVILGSGVRSICCPLHTLWCPDLVAITPISSGVLHIVVKYELIHGCDHVEIAFPLDIAGLEDGYFLHVLPSTFHKGIKAYI